MTSRSKRLIIITVVALSVLSYVGYRLALRRAQPTFAAGCNCTNSSQCPKGRICVDDCDTPGQGTCQAVIEPAH